MLCGLIIQCERYIKIDFCLGTILYYLDKYRALQTMNSYNEKHHSNYINTELSHYIDEVSRTTCERLKKNKCGLTCFSKFKITHAQFMDPDTVPSEICSGCVKHRTGLMQYMADKMQYYDEHECRNMVVIKGESTEYRTLPYKLRSQIQALAMGYYGIPIDGGWTCNNQFTFGEILFNEQRANIGTDVANQGAWDLTMLKVSKAISDWNMQAMLNRINDLTEKVESLESRIYNDI